MEIYKKPALTFREQVNLLKARGLCIKDEDRTIRHLSCINYYRLSAYMLPFKEVGFDGRPSDLFKQAAAWDDIYNLYRFDRKLRLLVFDVIERIEIALRTQIIYQLSHKYGSHWQNNKAIFNTPKLNPKTNKMISVFSDIQKHINEQLNSNKKAAFIKHYLNKYDSPKTPPCWMSVELLYLGELSKICKGLANKEDILNIAKSFQVHNTKVFCSWLHTINYLRNICAHHARLWNIKLDIQPIKYKNPPPNLIWFSQTEMQTVQSSKLYYSICIILYLLQTINPNTKFRQHFSDLLNEYPNVNLEYMGFPENWATHPLWKMK